MQSFDTAVIGAGGAGTMAYLRSVLNADRTVLFAGSKDTKRRGRAMWVSAVDNIPGMHDLKRPITASTKSTLKWLEGEENLREYGEVIDETVTRVEAVEGGFLLHHEHDDEAATLRARFVILATGVTDVQPEICGSILPILPFANRGEVIYCVRCDGHHTIGHRLAVIGKDEMCTKLAALMIQRYGHEDVGILTNGVDPTFDESARKRIARYGLQVHKEPIRAVLGDSKAGLQGFMFEDRTQFSCTRAIVSLGIIAFNQLLTGLGGQVDAAGKAFVSAKYESSVPGFFVVGDLVAGKKMQIYTAWDAAVDAADEINLRLRRSR